MENNDKTLTCITLDEYILIKDTELRAEWLRNKGELLNPTELYKSAEETHLIKDIASIEILRSLVSKKLGEINSMQHYRLYGCYLSFDEATENIITIPRFKVGSYCFSYALIRGIAQRHELRPNDKLEFIWANVTEKNETSEKLIIKLDGKNLFYNFSDEPGMIGDYNPI